MGEWQEPPKPGAKYFAGLDLARVEDYTVLAIANEARQVVHMDRFTRLDWTIQVDRVTAACTRYNRAEILVDSTGAGEPIYESLLEAGNRVEPYTFTNRSKAALVDNLALMLEQMLVCLPRPDLDELAETLLEELAAFEYSITEAGTVRSGAPSGIHDDTVIALALAMWHLRLGKLGGAFEETIF